MNRDFWIQKWQEDKVFVLDKDRLKEKSFVFSPFPKTNAYGFQKGEVRTLISSDLIARYLRMKGKNVLFPTGYHSLCNTAFIENKKHSTILNDDISHVFQSQMLKLGIGINEQKDMDMRHNPYLCNLQQAFLDFYDKGFIEYKTKKVYHDAKRNKIYDINLKSYNLPTLHQSCFVLNVKPILKDLISSIDALALENKYKQEFKSIFKPTHVLHFELAVTNGAKIKTSLEEPQYMGGICFIFLNPDYIDLTEYVDINEYQSVIQYLEDENQTAISAFSGLFAINPLTAKRIPIFISTLFPQDVYLGIPGIDDEDKSLANMMEIETIEIVSNEVLFHSDFLDGYSVSDAKEAIFNSFIDADLAYEEVVYKNHEILLSSLDTFGPLFPFLEDKDTKEIHSLEGHLPYAFSSKLRPTLPENVDIIGDTMSGTMNHLFTEGMSPFISMIYDEIGSILPIFSKDAYHEFEAWGGIAYIAVYEDSLISSILMPLIFNEFIGLYHQHKLPKLFHKIEIFERTTDLSMRDLSRLNNNLIDFEHVLDTYDSDAIRMFYLQGAAEEEFIYNPYHLKDIEDIVDSLKKKIMEFSEETPKIDYALFTLMKKCNETLEKQDCVQYAKELYTFITEYVIPYGLSKRQTMTFIKLIYPLCPFLAEEMNKTIFNGKYSIMNEEWPEE